MQVTFTIFYTQVKTSATLFNARRNYTRPNFGNSINVEVLIEADATYQKLCGKFDDNINGPANYGLFLADCIKYNLRITGINGAKTSINPYNESFSTQKETVVVELELV